MIVDDERFNIDVLLGFIMMLGIADKDERTDLAMNGEQAVEHMKRAIEEGEPHRYGLILMDCNMPFLDGYGATK